MSSHNYSNRPCSRVKRLFLFNANWFRGKGLPFFLLPLFISLSSEVTQTVMRLNIDLLFSSSINIQQDGALRVAARLSLRFLSLLVNIMLQIDSAWTAQNQDKCAREFRESSVAGVQYDRPGSHSVGLYSLNKAPVSELKSPHSSSFSSVCW